MRGASAQRPGSSIAHRVWRVLTIGGLFALASLYKPIAAAAGVFLAAAHLIAPWPGHSRRRALTDVLMIGSVGAAVWLGTGAYFAARGHFSDFYQAVFAYNNYYASHHMVDDYTLREQSMLGNLVNSFHPEVVLPGVMVIAASLAVFALAGAARGVACGPRRSVAVAIWPRHRKAPGSGDSRTLAPSLLPALASAPGGGAGPSRRSRGLYFESFQSPPSGAFYAFPLIDGPLAGPLTMRALADLERQPPTMFIIHMGFLYQGRLRHPILDWAETRYVALAGNGQYGPFLLFARRGSRLDVKGPQLAVR